MPERRRRDEDDENRPRAPRRDGKPPARRGGKPPAKRDGKPPAKRGGKPPAARSGRPPARGARRDGERRDGPPARRGRPSARGQHQPPRHKRTSKNSDERNPTRSGIEYPSRKTRPVGGAPEPAAPKAKSSLRKIRSEPAKAKQSRERKPKSAPPTRPRRRRSKPSEALDELARIAGRGAAKAQDQLTRAAEAYSAGRERDAARLLRPLRDSYPDVAAIRELLGLCQYRLGNYDAATAELEAFAQLSGDVEQHPVLMDCARAKRKYRRVDELWRELADASPSAALVTEGRIVLAGSLADRGRLQDAIETLEKRGGTDVKRVQEHHVRLWYALADLYERAGDIPAARTLFLRIRKHEAGFADVAERLAALN